MAEARYLAWQELQAMGHVCAKPFRAAATREKLTARILELAKQGEDDVSILKDYASAYFLWSVSPASTRLDKPVLGFGPRNGARG